MSDDLLMSGDLLMGSTDPAALTIKIDRAIAFHDPRTFIVDMVALSDDQNVLLELGGHTVTLGWLRNIVRQA